jgi:hypothetical protein
VEFSELCLFWLALVDAKFEKLPARLLEQVDEWLLLSLELFG